METLNELPYIITPAKNPAVPLIISIPHVGTEFPKELRDNYLPSQLANLDDTDWFLTDLYNFAADLGITVISARYHRWVIDLNRDPKSAPLYTDGRIITGLTTTTDFFGNPIYQPGKEPDQNEIDRRLNKYYWPYYQAIENLLNERKQTFGKVILWDAHSIRQFVPTIRAEKFPEMILGDADGQAAALRLSETCLTNLRTGYQVNHNDPFKGGHITRYFGKPTNHVHALQLERTKNLYMDDQERNFDESRASIMRITLKQTLQALINQL